MVLAARKMGRRGSRVVTREHAEVVQRATPNYIHTAALNPWKTFLVRHHAMTFTY